MSWDATVLTEDQRDIVQMVTDWRSSGAPVTADDEAQAAIEGAVELGVWSIGMPERWDGGGAELDLRLAALAALAGHAASVAWACAQAHAAVEVLSAASGTDGLITDIASGGQRVAVVDLASPATRLSFDGTTASGMVARIDAAGADPVVVVLDGADAAWLLETETVELGPTLRRTGLAGAGTATATVNGPAVRIDGVDGDGVRARLRLAAAAIAAGLSLDAAEAAGAYAASRVQFGAPLVALPTVRRSVEHQHHQAVESVAAVLRGGQPDTAGAAGVLADNLTRAIDVGAAAVQVHGGYGYIEEYGIARLMRDAVSLRAAAGVI